MINDQKSSDIHQVQTVGSVSATSGKHPNVLKRDLESEYFVVINHQSNRVLLSNRNYRASSGESVHCYQNYLGNTIKERNRVCADLISRGVSILIKGDSQKRSHLVQRTCDLKLRDANVGNEVKSQVIKKDGNLATMFAKLNDKKVQLHCSTIKSEKQKKMNPRFGDHEYCSKSPLMQAFRKQALKAQQKSVVSEANPVEAGRDSGFESFQEGPSGSTDEKLSRTDCSELSTADRPRTHETVKKSFIDTSSDEEPIESTGDDPAGNEAKTPQSRSKRAKIPSTSSRGEPERKLRKRMKPQSRKRPNK